MKIDSFAVYHYLYGYQPMRLASQEEINSSEVPDDRCSTKPEERKRRTEGGDETGKRGQIKSRRKIRPPDGIALCISSIPGAKYGACAMKDIPAGTWFGPYEGKLVRRNENVGGALSEFMWEIFHDGEVSHFLDGLYQNAWMSFVKCARHKTEQNMVVFQYHGCIYYRTIREIVPGSELLVWYDAKYTQLLGLPIAWNDIKSSHGKRKITTTNASGGLRKKRVVESESKESSLNPRECNNEKSQCLTLRNNAKNNKAGHIEAPNYQKEAKTVGRNCTHAGRPTGLAANSTAQAYSLSNYSHATQIPHIDAHSFRDEKDSLESIKLCMDKNRQYNENWRQMQGPGYNHLRYPAHNDTAQVLNRKMPADCKMYREKQQFSPHQITMTSQVHDLQGYYHYTTVKHEETCRFTDTKPAFRPIA